MKKIGLLILPLLITACHDKPKAEILLEPCCSLGDELGILKLSLWNDRAVLNVQGQDIELTDKNFEEGKARQVYSINWTGKMPDSDREIIIRTWYDTETEQLAGWSVAMSDTGGYGTDVVVPIKLDKYKLPSATEKCAHDIASKTAVFGDKGGVFVGRNVYEYDFRGAKEKHNGVFYEKIPAADAIKISPNWDYNNLKLYKTGHEAHEADACDVLARLNDYIDAHGWNETQNVYLDEIGCDRPERIVYLGCDMAAFAQFQYMTLNICADGRHTLDFATDWFGPDSVTRSEKDGDILYSGTRYGMPEAEVLYKPELDKWFVRFDRASGAYTACTQGQLMPHQICARTIASITQLNPDGSVAYDVKQGQSATENGHELEREWVTLTQQQALRMSKNWDYKNIKLYTTGDAPHEVDACEVLNRLNDIRWSLRK